MVVERSPVEHGTRGARRVEPSVVVTVVEGLVATILLAALVSGVCAVLAWSLVQLVSRVAA